MRWRLGAAPLLALLALLPNASIAADRCVEVGPGVSFRQCPEYVNASLEKPWRVLVYRYEEGQATYRFLGPIDQTSLQAANDAKSRGALEAEETRRFFGDSSPRLRYDGPFAICPTHGDTNLELESPEERSRAERWRQAIGEIRSQIERCRSLAGAAGSARLGAIERRLRALKARLQSAEPGPVESVLTELLARSRGDRRGSGLRPGSFRAAATRSRRRSGPRARPAAARRRRGPRRGSRGCRTWCRAPASARSRSSRIFSWPIL